MAIRPRSLPAIQLVPKVLSVEETKGIYAFGLAESRQGPPESGTGRREFRPKLKEGESFENEFMGASEDDCQSWAEQQWRRYNTVE